jgi:hypothetical protein
MNDQVRCSQDLCHAVVVDEEFQVEFFERFFDNIERQNLPNRLNVFERGRVVVGELFMVNEVENEFGRRE